MLAQEFMTAQTGVLGSMVMNPDVVGLVVTQLSADDFAEGPYRQIFEAYAKAYGAGLPCDPYAVGNGLMDPVRKLMGQLLETSVTSANAQAYTDMVKAKSRQVRLQALGFQLAQETDGQVQADLVAEMVALGNLKSKVRITSLAQGYEDFIDEISSGKSKEFMTWGLSKLDENLFVEAGDLVVIGGYPSAGKTAFALQVCMHVALGKRVGYFYLENNDKKLIGRLVSAVTKLSMGDIKRNKLDETACKRILDFGAEIKKPQIDFIDSAGMTVTDITAIANSHRYDVVVVDYLQKVASGKTAKGWDDFARVSAVSDGLQVLGKTTGRTVIALSQLSRAERDKAAGKVKAPTMASLRQSGQIEQDADVVLLLYEDDPDKKGSRTLKIAKNKEGEAGKGLLLDFDGSVQTFAQRELTPGEQYRATQAAIAKAAMAIQLSFTELPSNEGDLPEEMRA